MRYVKNFEKSKRWLFLFSLLSQDVKRDQLLDTYLKWK